MDAGLLSSRARSNKNFPLWPFRKHNRNVVLTWITSLFEGAGDSVWNGTVLVALIYEIMGKSNSYAGYVEAVQGLTMLIVALPVGWIADRSSKSKVIIAGALCIPVAVAATAFAGIYGVAHPKHSFLCFYVLLGAMVLWGTTYSIYGGAQQALLADSTPTQGRSWYYTKSSQVQLVASALGPIVAIGVFLAHGDQWDTASLRNGKAQPNARTSTTLARARTSITPAHFDHTSALRSRQRTSITPAAASVITRAS